MEKFLSATLEDVSRLCEAGYYDYIIVGSGMGGGVLARTLIEDEKEPRVLLIERGSLIFSSHCLNTSCMHWSHNIPEGPSQDNDIVYRAVKESIGTVTSESYSYVGGPVHCLGGRSTVWGLYTPNIHEEEAKKYFPKAVYSYLFGKDDSLTGYNRAYRLLSNDAEADHDKPYPGNGSVAVNINDIDNVLKRLTQSTKCPFTLCPMGAEFVPRDAAQTLYQIPMGGYSTVNWILNRVYNKDERLTVLTQTQVLTVNSEMVNGSSSAVSLTALDRFGKEGKIPVGKATVILCAGTIDTAAIALRSRIGTGNGNDSLVGKGLMDHDIWGTRVEILQSESVKKLKNQPLKLQSWVKFNHLNDWVLINIALNANTFLGRSQEEKFPARYFDEKGELLTGPQFEDRMKDRNATKSTLQVIYEFCAPLDNKNKVLNLPEPTPTIRIEQLEDNSVFLPDMQSLTLAIEKALEPVMWGTGPNGSSVWPIGCCNRPSGCCFGKMVVGPPCPCFGSGGKDRCPCFQHKYPPPLDPVPRLSKVDFGAVAHEVGTMRMPSPRQKTSVVDENLQVNGWDNLFVCDLCVFPVSPSANPSLTLAALAQRLADHLLGNA